MNAQKLYIWTTSVPGSLPERMMCQCASIIAILNTSNKSLNP
jgi:hypothetical protein